ncbi:hypothetical protein [Campylobacter concisus]|nr:hypothetical protein [Campylobacter concisus]
MSAARLRPDRRKRDDMVANERSTIVKVYQKTDKFDEIKTVDIH